MKRYYICLIAVALLLLVAFKPQFSVKPELKYNQIKQYEKPLTVIPKADSVKLKEKAKEALTYCKQKKFNTSFCVLIDLGLHSGIKRFFVYDFKKDSIIQSCLTGHGCGESPWSYDFSKENPIFSNEEGSHCSSLGKYKIGARAYSDWGINVKYILHGLEASNSNALKRLIVFHSWDLISDTVVYPDGSPEGWGCPVISNDEMLKMDSMLKKTSTPVLMWIFK